MGCGVCFFSLRIGLGSGFVVLSLGGAVGVFGWASLFLFVSFWRVSFPRVLGISSFFSFTFLSFVGV